MIDDVPDAFKDWCKRNAGNIELAKQGKRSMPYFVRDNMALVNKLLQPAVTVAPRRTPLQIAAARHAARTQEQIDAIKKRAEERQVMLRYADGTPFSAAQLASFAVLEKKLGVKRGRPMTIEQADEQSTNPNYSVHGGYRTNCATCVPTFMMRLAGFDVVARPNVRGLKTRKMSHSPVRGVWVNADGTSAEPATCREWMLAKGYRRMNESRYRSFFKEKCAESGFYELVVGWSRRAGGGGHATILYRAPSGTLFHIEPQLYNGKVVLRTVGGICDSGTAVPGDQEGVLRVDDKVLNADLAEIFSADKASEISP